MAVPLASAAKVVTLGSLKRYVNAFRVADVALCDMPVFHTYSKRVKGHSVWQARYFCEVFGS